MGSIFGSEGDEDTVRNTSTHTYRHTFQMGDEALQRMSGMGGDASNRMKERLDLCSEPTSFLIPDGVVSRGRAGLLFIESYRELPLQYGSGN